MNRLKIKQILRTANQARQFSNNPMNVNKFIDLIIKEHNSSTLLRTINKLSKKQSKNKFIKTNHLLNSYEVMTYECPLSCAQLMILYNICVGLAILAFGDVYKNKCLHCAIGNAIIS